MQLINPFSNSEQSSIKPRMSLSHLYSQQSELAYNASEMIDQKVSTQSQEVIKNIRPIAHDFQLCSYNRDPYTQRCCYQMRARNRGLELNLEINFIKDDNILLNTQKVLHQTLSHLKFTYVDLIENFETLLSNECRNNILHAYFGDLYSTFVYYDIEDYVNAILTPLQQVEPDWILKLESTELFLDPLPLPSVTPTLLKDLLINATSWEFL